MSIRRLLDDYGLSENKLAKRSGVPRSTINSMKNAKKQGIGNIKLEHAKKLAKSLGCTVDELMDWYG